jgi:hypothetical protein
VVSWVQVDRDRRAEEVRLNRPSPLTVSSRGASLFLVDRGDVKAGDGSFSSFVRCDGLEVGVDLGSLILLLLRKLRERFTSSNEEF